MRRCLSLPVWFGLALCAASASAFALDAAADDLENPSPALRLRGDVMDFPFYLGTDLYHGRWAGYVQIEAATHSWWLDRERWRRTFETYAELRLNALLLCHPHPFPALIELPGGPEAAYFDAMTLRRHAEHFHWLLETAATYGVRIYFLTWNIWTSPGFARQHGIPMEGHDSPAVRDYTRECYRRLFEAYPQLAGVMTMAGEAPPGCVEFVRDAVVGGLNPLEHKPELLYWLWCSYPEDAVAVFDAYQGPGVPVRYLQYEQLIRPQADPRIRRLSDAVGGRRIVVMGGLGTATGFLFWSDPYYLRDILADLLRQGGDGCFFLGLDSFGWVAPKWLGWEALGRYAWDPHRPREDDYWRARIAKHYDCPDVAGDYLDAAIAASAIPTRMLDLLHRQTDHHQPQFGLPLVHYLGLPTLSTYVFENHTGIDEQGRLVPRLGLTWPNPDWGERVLGVVDFVAGATAGTTPLAIADDLERHAGTVQACIERLARHDRQVSVGPEAWAKVLDQLAMNAHLGAHTAAKIRAAVAWERWQQGRTEPAAVLEPLVRSADAMARMAEAAARCYPGVTFHTWRSCISRPLPWSHLDLWNTGCYREHGFADSAAMFGREVEWVRRELEAGYPQPLLPFEDDLLPRPEHARCVLAWDFEGEAPAGLRLADTVRDATAALTRGEAPLPLVGRRLAAAYAGSDFWMPLVTAADALPLRTGKRYWVAADYWIVDSREAPSRWLAAGARTTEGGWREDIAQRFMEGPPGTRGRITVRIEPAGRDDYFFFVSIHGPAVIELDNFELWEGD